MAAPTEATAAVGDLVTASLWNTNVRDGVNWNYGGAASRKAILRLHLAAVQSIPNSAFTVIKWDTTDEDTDSGYSAATGIWTCVQAGFYEFNFFGSYAASGTGIRQAQIATTGTPATVGTPQISAAVDSSGQAGATLQTRLSVGQTVKAQVIQTSGGALNFSAGSFFTGYQIGL